MRFTRASLTAVALIGLGVAVAAPAQAAQVKATYTVKVGTTTTGTAALTATGSRGFGLFDLSVGSSALSCSSLTSKLTAKLSPTSTGKKIAKVAKTTWGGCYTYDGVPVNVTTKSTWLLNAIGPADSNGLMPILTTKVKISVVATGGQCSYQLTGSFGGTYDDSSGALALGTESPALVVSDFVGGTSNCDIDGNGDKLAPGGTETVTATSPTGAFTITAN